MSWPYIDADAPVHHESAGGIVKKVLRKLMSFYVQHVARNVTAFATTIVRAVKLLGGRVERLEATLPGTDGRVREAFGRGCRARSLGVDQPWSRCSRERSGSGWWCSKPATGHRCERSSSAGLDAYGVEPDVAVADGRPARRARSARSRGAVAHLRRVPVDALGAIVLIGCVERLPTGALVELAELPASRLAVGGVVVVVSANPVAALVGSAAVAADLAPRPPAPRGHVGALVGTTRHRRLRRDRAAGRRTLEPDSR